MGNRIFLVVAMLAGVVFMATSASAAPAAEECLAKPKGPAPAGKHWYYQTNRAVQRKCWYLDDEGEKTVAATPRKQPTSAITSNRTKWPACSRRPRTRAPSWLTRPRVEQPAAEQPAVPVAPPQREATQGASGVSVHPMARVRVTGPLRRVGRTPPSRSPPRMRRRSAIPHRRLELKTRRLSWPTPRRSNSRPRLSITPAAWTLPRLQPR